MITRVSPYNISMKKLSYTSHPSWIAHWKPFLISPSFQLYIFLYFSVLQLSLSKKKKKKKKRANLMIARHGVAGGRVLILFHTQDA
jgi:hypothetical protein